MDPRYRSPIEQATARYIKLLNLKSNKSIRSLPAQHLLRELRQLLYAYLGVILPEKMNEVVPMMGLSDLAVNKTHEKSEFDALMDATKKLTDSIISKAAEDDQLDKVSSRVSTMLRIYRRQQMSQDKPRGADNITSI